MRHLCCCVLSTIGLIVAQTPSLAQDKSPPATELGTTMTAEALFGTSRPGQPKRRVAPDTSTDLPTMQITGVASTDPALRYRFWPNPLELKPGSANIYAGRALISMQHVNRSWARQAEQTGETHPFSIEFNDQLTLEKIKPYSNALRHVVNELGRLALCEDQTRDLRIRDERGSAIFSVLLPEIQQSRDSARGLRIRIRTQTLQRDFDAAVETLMYGFRLGDYVGNGETLVERLVGNAIMEYMLDEIEFMIQQPECPNLYWALAGLPPRLGDPADQAIVELSLMKRHLPILALAEEGDFSDQVWLSRWTQMVSFLKEADQTELKEFSLALSLGLLSNQAIKTARQSLVDQGVDPIMVRNMSKFRAVLLDANHKLTMQTDSLKKGFLLSEPYRQQVIDEASQKWQQSVQENPEEIASLIGDVLFPSASATNRAGIRTQLKIRRLMAVEAIRDFVARNGKLPETLNGTVLAVPNDPYVESAFGYSVDNQDGDIQFVLTAETSDDSESLKTVRVKVN